MNHNSKIYIAGHLGLVGSAIHRNLLSKGYTNIITRDLDQLDLTSQQATDDFFRTEKPEYVIDAAAKVGGILANNIYRAQFIYENLMIQNNIIHSSWKYGVKKLLFLGSSCIYPKDAPQPMKEEYLLTGPLEYTNEPYAIAKIAGIKMCESYHKQYGCNFISVMPTNLYGPNDNYDLEKSHVLPALIRKMHLGKCLMNGDWQSLRKDLDKRPVEGINGRSTEEEILNILGKYGLLYPRPSTSLPVRRGNEGVDKTRVTLWGTGNIYREFLHVDDMADACVFVMENIDVPIVKTRHASSQTEDGGRQPAASSIQHPASSIGQETFFLNIGTGTDLTIKELAETVKKIVGFEGELVWDASKPDGTYKKQLDVSLLNGLGWKERIGLEDGIRTVYENYVL